MKREKRRVTIRGKNQIHVKLARPKIVLKQALPEAESYKYHPKNEQRKKESNHIEYLEHSHILFFFFPLQKSLSIIRILGPRSPFLKIMVDFSISDILFLLGLTFSQHIISHPRESMEVDPLTCEGKLLPPKYRKQCSNTAI